MCIDMNYTGQVLREILSSKLYQTSYALCFKKVIENNYYYCTKTNTTFCQLTYFIYEMIEGELNLWGGGGRIDGDIQLMTRWGRRWYFMGYVYC